MARSRILERYGLTGRPPPEPRPMPCDAVHYYYHPAVFAVPYSSGVAWLCEWHTENLPHAARSAAVPIAEWTPPAPPAPEQTTLEGL